MHHQESLELASRGARQVAVTSLSFPANDVNKFLVGSEECVAYQVGCTSEPGFGWLCELWRSLPRARGMAASRA